MNLHFQGRYESDRADRLATFGCEVCGCRELHVDSIGSFDARPDAFDARPDAFDDRLDAFDDRLDDQAHESSAAVLELGECPRCDHRWMRTVSDGTSRVAPRRSLPALPTGTILEPFSNAA